MHLMTRSPSLTARTHRAETSCGGLRFHLLGHMRVVDSQGRSVLPRTRKARAVLAIVALAAPRPVLRLQLTALLWSQRQKEQGRASLRQAIHDIQDSLGETAQQYLLAERHLVTLRSEMAWIDVQEAGRAQLQWNEAAESFRAPLLEDLGGLDPAFDQWLATERARCLQIGLTLGEQVLAQARDPAERAEVAAALLRVDPLHEPAWRATMRACLDQGDAESAIIAYDRCRASLAAAGRDAPGTETEDLIAAIRARAGPPSGASRPVPVQRLPGSVEPGGRSGVRLGIAPPRVIGAGAAEDLSLGLAEEITTTLSRFRWISCISGVSWATLSGDTRPEAMFSTLGLDFMLDGTIQQTGERARINVRLMDMRSAGAVIWAQRFDRALSDVLTLQDEVASLIVALIDSALLMHEGQRVAAQQIANPTSQELVLQAVPAVYRLERGGFEAAGRLLDAAVAGDSAHALAHAWYAYWHLFLVGQGWASDVRAAAQRAAELAERAVMLDPGDARALALAGHVQSFLGKRAAEGGALHERAISLNPNLALAWCFSGLALSYLGQHDEALRRMFQAVRLSPSDPHLFFFDHALIMPHLMLGEYESAADIGRRATELNPAFTSTYKGYLCALGHAGRDREATAVLNRLLELEPGFSVAEAIERSPLVRTEDLQRYADGLRRAGLPERRPG